jgi:hypothetical protein
MASSVWLIDTEEYRFSVRISLGVFPHTKLSFLAANSPLWGLMPTSGNPHKRQESLKKGKKSTAIAR